MLEVDLLIHFQEAGRRGSAGCELDSERWMESRVASWKITGKSLVLFFQDSVFCRCALVKVGRGALITYTNLHPHFL